VEHRVTVTPLIFIGYLLVTRQWRAAATALATFLGTVLAGFVLMPADAARYWGGLVLHSSRAGGVWDTPNQSVAGALSRGVSGTQFAHWWLVVLAVLAVLGLAVAHHVHRHGSDFLGFSAAAITGLLVSPVSWEHHWVYVIPLLVFLAVRAYRTRSAGLAAATAALVTVFSVRVFSLLGIEESPPAPMALAGWEQVIAALFPLTGLLLLLAAPLWIRRGAPVPAARPATRLPVREPAHNLAD
jgi:alpha-1,2-mannosyltransferase